MNTILILQSIIALACSPVQEPPAEILELFRADWVEPQSLDPHEQLHLDRWISQNLVRHYRWLYANY